MRRFLMLLGVAVVAAAMYVAASPASQSSKGPTAKQFKALKRQVAGLSRKVKALTASNNALVASVTSLTASNNAIVGVLQACMQGAVPINDFGDPNGTFGYHWFDSTDGEILTTALDLTAPTDTNALWITGSTGTGCKTALGGSGLQHAAAKAGIKVQPLRLPSTFAVHRH